MREATLEDANWYCGYILYTALSDRLDLYLKTQAKNLAQTREALNAVGVMAEMILRAPAVDETLWRLFTASPAQRKTVAVAAQGYTTREIGEYLGIPEDTAATYLKRARAAYEKARRKR